MKKKKILVNIYRHCKYWLFKLFYSKIRTIVTAKKIKSISIKKIFFKNNAQYKLYNIPYGRVYSDTVNDTAFIINKSLIKEPSFQFRFKKNYQIINGSVNENFVLKNGTPNVLKKIDGNVFSLLTGGAGKNNYWHWLFDVLPRIGILEKSNFQIKPDYYLLPSLSKNYKKAFNIAGKLSLNEWRGEKNVEFIIDDISVNKMH